MGFYYFSYFENSSKKIKLAHDCNIIEKSDINRGYILKSELLNYYGHLGISEEDITEDAYVVVYEWCTLNLGDNDYNEYRKLQIK